MVAPWLASGRGYRTDMGMGMGMGMGITVTERGENDQPRGSCPRSCLRAQVPPRFTGHLARRQPRIASPALPTAYYHAPLSPPCHTAVLPLPNTARRRYRAPNVSVIPRPA